MQKLETSKNLPWVEKQKGEINNSISEIFFMFLSLLVTYSVATWLYFESQKDLDVSKDISGKYKININSTGTNGNGSSLK